MRQIGFPAAGGGSDTPAKGTVTSVNGTKPDAEGNVQLTALPSAQYATDSDIDALWQ